MYQVSAGGVVAQIRLSTVVRGSNPAGGVWVAVWVMASLLPQPTMPP